MHKRAQGNQLEAIEHVPSQRRLLSLSAATVCIAALLGLSACQTPQQVVSQKEDSLAAAGFIVRPANTPERQAMLNRLPPHHFVQRVRGDDVRYVYADPLVCNCLYVGTQNAYATYRQQQQQKQIADQQEMTASMYNDNAWNWGAWGPYEGFDGGYGGGFGPGIGW